jgi:hypothetical protein
LPEDLDLRISGEGVGLPDHQILIRRGVVGHVGAQRIPFGVPVGPSLGDPELPPKRGSGSAESLAEDLELLIGGQAVRVPDHEVLVGSRVIGNVGAEGSPVHIPIGASMGDAELRAERSDRRSRGGDHREEDDPATEEDWPRPRGPSPPGIRDARNRRH